jgi:hypothetical protein
MRGTHCNHFDSVSEYLKDIAMSQSETVSSFSFPDPKTTDPDQRFVQRFFEILPGTITWFIILGIPLLSFVLPVWVAVFVIAFDIYWIYKSLFVLSYTLGSYRRLRKSLILDWHSLFLDTENIADAIDRREHQLRALLNNKTHHNKTSRRERRKHIRKSRSELRLLQSVARNQKNFLKPKDIINVVMLPTATEGAEIIEPSIRAIAESSFPNEQTIILLATEKNEPAKQREEKVRILTEKFGSTFRDFIVTTHRVKEGEMKCKASNATYAAKHLRAYLDEKGIAYERVILSNLDCDTICHSEYLSALAFLYTTEPKRLAYAYQPLPMYNNNIWDTNAFVRVVVFNSTYWHMFQSTRQRMVTFSSHSEAFATIVKVGYWPVNMISEDSVIYWKGFSFYGGEYRTKIIPLPVSMDAALAENYFKTLGNQYKQLRRWAYGMENLPLVMRAILPNKRISFFRKMHVLFELLEGHVLWATAPIILGFVGWMPILFGGPAFKESVLGHNLPFITGYLMTAAMSGLLVIAALNFLLLPPRPKRYSRWKYINFALQWLLVPIMGPFIIALPAIDAQTRLMFGRYFGSFWVTEKVRRKDS